MLIFPRRLKVSKVDTFTIDVVNWAKGESIETLVVTETTGLATVRSSSFVDSKLTVSLEGNDVGAAEIKYDYTTTTRSTCTKVKCIVESGC